MIGVDHGAASAGVKAIREATVDFDEAAASKNPDSSGAGAAQGMLADVLATAADTALKLVQEIDTLADNADSGLSDLESFDSGAALRLSNISGPW